MSATLRLYTAFVCPFCFIAEQSTVPRLPAEFDLTLDWRGFELHPSTPKGGLPLQRLFPNQDLDQMHEGTKRFAARFGVTNFQPPQRLQNSRRALAVAEWARSTGRLEPFRAAAFNAHWRRGKDRESAAALRELAAAAGLEPAAALGEALRKAAPAGIGSSGVKRSRGDTVAVESQDAEEVVLRGRAPGRPVAPTVVLYPGQRDWDCDCAGRMRPCEHIVAAALVLAQAGDKPAGVATTATAWARDSL